MTTAGMTGNLRAAAVNDMQGANHGHAGGGHWSHWRLTTWAKEDPRPNGPAAQRLRTWNGAAPGVGSGADPGRSSHEHADLGEHALALEVRLCPALRLVDAALVQDATNLLHSPAVHGSSKDPGGWSWGQWTVDGAVTTVEALVMRRRSPCGGDHGAACEG